MPVDSASGPCHPEACAIQTCLMNNAYQESRCQSQLAALWRCCDQFYKQKGPEAECDACMKPSLLKLKLERLEKGEV
ncbi:Cx9C motif-containing protein 4, mitochondrial [Rhodosporidiobolus nylandii]